MRDCQLVCVCVRVVCVLWRGNSPVQHHVGMRDAERFGSLVEAVCVELERAQLHVQLSEGTLMLMMTAHSIRALHCVV